MASERLRIDFRRSGGVTGISLTTSIDVEELSGAEETALREMVERMDLDDLTRSLVPRPGVADRFIYELTIEKGDKKVDLYVGESEMTEDLRALVTELERRAKNR